DADLALGRHADLAGELEAIVVAEPLRERLHAQLMLALYRGGRQAEALEAYRDARDLLLDGLGIEPGPELRALEAAILRQDESLLATAAPAAAIAASDRRRKIVTVLFVDVVDVLALAQALDAEALQDVLERLAELVAGAVERHGGTVERSVGETVM